MAGKVIPLISLRSFDFVNVSNSSFIEIIMIKSVDVSQWTSAELQVRVHSADITDSSGSPTIDVIAYAIDQSREDPSQMFVGDTALATCSLGTGTSAPDLITDSLSSVPGAVQITVKGTKVTASTLNAEISVDLVVKDS